MARRNGYPEMRLKRGSENTVIPATAEPHFTASPSMIGEPDRDCTITGGLTNEAIHAELARILSSATFIRSKRLGRFLRFTVEQCLEGRQNSLKEYLVGVEVFNKLETFDPRIDSIVRVEARRLRSKLERYYQTEGREDQVVVQFRKGSYVPMIMTREQYQASGYVDGSARGRSGKKSITVSRFTNLGIDPAYSFFCSGITEDIVSALTKIPEFRVVARHPGLHGGEDVKSDYILEGSVRKQGERLRISAQLIDTATSVYVWSETYERDLSDAFAVQDEISLAIVGSLRSEFNDAHN
jgi:adenylate cyclase